MQTGLIRLVALLATSGLGLAAPAFTGDNLEITNVRLSVVQSANTTLTFNLYDPEPVAIVNTTCAHVWRTGSQDFGVYKLCQDDSVVSHVEIYNSPQSFTLQIQHSFKDPSIGDPPYDRVITYSRGNTSNTLIFCIGRRGTQTCTQRQNTTIEAPIYAAAA